MDNEETKVEVTEVSATPTAVLKIKDRELHQLFQVTYSDGTTKPELRPIPEHVEPVVESETAAE